MLGVRLDKDTEERLNILCQKTGHTKSYYAKKAIKEFIDDREDYLLAMAWLEESKEFISLKEARKHLVWTVKLNKTSEKALSKFDKQAQVRLLDFLQKLEKNRNPRENGRALKGELNLFWRYRVGDCRIICQIKEEEITILVLAIDRKDIYKKPKWFFGFPANRMTQHLFNGFTSISRAVRELCRYLSLVFAMETP